MIFQDKCYGEDGSESYVFVKILFFLSCFFIHEIGEVICSQVILLFIPKVKPRWKKGVFTAATKLSVLRLVFIQTCRLCVGEA